MQQNLFSNNKLPIVVNKKKSKYDIYIGRGSKWGNPYTHLKFDTKAKYIVETREESIRLYEVYARNNKEIMENLYLLEGKILGCFCKPKDCHGDILVKLFREKFCNG